MAPRLPFQDPRAAADALTFVRRAATLPEPGVRLAAHDGVLAISTAVLAPRGLTDTVPTVLGLRATEVDHELETDVVVDPALIVADPADPSSLTLPATAFRAAWAGIAPPRAGWHEVGTVPASTLAALAHAGVAEVAETLPQQPGEDVARSIRTRVWSRPTPDLGGLPAGAAFAALALGFIAGGEDVRMLTSGAWHRLSLARGHVLVRGSAARVAGGHDAVG